MKASVEAKKIVKQFGANLLSDLDDLPDFYTFNKGILYSHRDFKEFYSAVKSGKKCAVVSGFNASGTIHLGHLGVFKTNLFFQKKYGCSVFIPISDDESYVVGKVGSQKEGLKNALALAREILALGFDPKKTYFIIDQIFTDIYNLAIKFSRGTTYNQIRASYGYSGESNPGVLFYPIIQTSHILMPQTKEFGNMQNVLVPIGLDEDTHIRISRDIAPKFDFKKPAILHSLFMPDLKGQKMSASRPESAIFLKDSMKDIKKKVGRALTGGRETVEEQREKGGIPSKCVVAMYLDNYYLTEEEANNLYKDCKEGKLLCGQCKTQLTQFVQDELTGFQTRLVEITNKTVNKCILRNNSNFTEFEK